MRSPMNAKQRKEAIKSYCEVCGERQGLILHHLAPVALGGSDELDNLQTMCRECHRKVHRWLHIPHSSTPRILGRGLVANTAKNILKLSIGHNERIVGDNNLATLEKLGLSYNRIKSIRKEQGDKDACL